MKLFSLITRLLPPKVPVHTEEECEGLVMSIVSAIATGNVSLQFGNCITEKMVAEQKKSILGHRF